MPRFAIIDAGKEYCIVPLTPTAMSYAAQCRGKMTYSKRTIAQSAVKRMEEKLERRIKREVYK
ncbi:hypothetical protein [Sporomusa sp.]|uniref:hypothetical protein n=1 Tax=Sporomusa sp. TaxID=2078658 RepID=UPI002B74A878|nr:hypothetical protein [Sporomusa sp.]HWR45661.1 hypothetical protein [Sporomusa sp.]